MDTLVVKVGGMTCGGCVASVRKVVTAVEGVASVDVSLTDARATVAYDAARTRPAAIKSAIRDAGFDAD
jgi:copper chaperone